MKTVTLPVNRVCVVGSGVIGSGWAARFLAHGLDVVATDPGVGAERQLRGNVAAAWPALEHVGLADGASQARLEFVADLTQALEGVDFVQESAPEREDLKRRLHASVDAVLAPEVLIASSSSGLLPTRIQADCRHPERVLIGHPFNPVYLLPLVELVGGEKTSTASLDRASALYTALGMHPLRVRKEVDGYIADRLQEAMWREAMHMVADGVASTAEIDAAITEGPGLRWALMGPCLTFHLAGGEGGMRHFVEHFGPAMSLPWTRCPAPKMTETLSGRLVDGTQAQALGRSVGALARRRDEFLIRLLELRRELDTETFRG